MLRDEWILSEAEKFIQTSYGELGKSPIEVENRLQEIRQAIAAQGTYEHTYEELKHGAKMAWATVINALAVYSGTCLRSMICGAWRMRIR